MNLYKLIYVPVWWGILVCVIQGRFGRLEKAIDYLDRRMTREIYRQQLRGWALDRKLKQINERSKVFGIKV